MLQSRVSILNYAVIVAVHQNFKVNKVFQLSAAKSKQAYCYCIAFFCQAYGVDDIFRIAAGAYSSCFILARVSMIAQ